MPKEKMDNKPELHVVNFSGGKDSTAMLLKMIEKGMRIDLILFCDTGLEFPSMYRHIEKVEKEIGRKVTRIKAETDFEYLMAEKPFTKKKTSDNLTENEDYRGYGWPHMRLRWCTHELKDVPRDQYLKQLRQNYNLIEYIGIAADETKRIAKPRFKRGEKRYPLIDWNMSEADCLAYCKERGFDWEGLYEHFKRVSCWCCPMMVLSELRNLYEHYPGLWKELKRLDEKTRNKFRIDYSVEELEHRFEFEKRWVEYGNKLRTRPFYDQLYKELGRK